jgi:hypothetical protein
MSGKRPRNKRSNSTFYTGTDRVMWTKPIAYQVLLITALIQATTGQTRVDVSRQTKNIDFGAASSTKPAKSGVTLPVNCSQAEVFLKTNAPDGANIYVCTEDNRWVPQRAVQIQREGTAVGVAPSLNFLSGPGILTSTSTESGAISIRHSMDTAIMETRENTQSGRSLSCESSSNSGLDYTCSMQPLLTQYTNGMLLRWVPDVANTGSPSLNIDALGPRPIHTGDGSPELPAGALQPGILYEIWYDGTAFRLPAEAKISIQANSLPAGTRATVDYVNGTGVTFALADTGGKVTIQSDADTTMMLTKAVAQSGAIWYAADSGGDDTYTVAMNPSVTTYTPGMFVLFVASTGSTGSPTLSLDGLIPTLLKENDCVTGATIVANRPYLFVYNGSRFCKVGGVADANARSLNYVVSLPIETVLSSNVMISGNGIHWKRVYNPTPVTINRLFFRIATASTSQTVAVGIYDSECSTLLASTGAQTAASIGHYEIPVPAVTLPAGPLYFAWTATDTTVALATGTIAPGAAQEILAAGMPTTGTADGAVTEGALPASCGVLTPRYIAPPFIGGWLE